MRALLGTAKLAVEAVKSAPKCHSLKPVRHHGTWNYRTTPPLPPKKDLIFVHVMQGIMWWWVMWHCWHEFSHLTLDFFPDVTPEEWTDEELGVPPDSEGLGGRTPVIY